MMENFYIGKKKVGKNCPTYFIADIAANHDGNLDKALELINKSAEAGADAAKFQHFSAETIVSDYGFKSLGSQQSHQASWTKSVFEVYKDASIPLEWTSKLKKECEKNNIEFLTSPYSIELVDFVNPYLEAFKIGSGDITWHEIIEHIAKKGKPYIIATGASNDDDVNEVILKASKINNKICIMQCNTNYTANDDNFKYINLNVLKTFRKKFPSAILGLSDHTFGHETVLGAVTLGARVVEKHFTDNNNRSGPDHKFALEPDELASMIKSIRMAEKANGDGIKKIHQVEEELRDFAVRSVQAIKDITIGEKFSEKNVSLLRPGNQKSGAEARFFENVLGKMQKGILQLEMG